MSLGTEVDGDPAACHRAARRLGRLGSTVEAGGLSLSRRAHLRDDDFGGLSGDAFRRRAATLAEQAAEEARRCTQVGRALEALADSLEDVQLLLLRARQEARGALVVDGSVIHAPQLDAPERQHRVWRSVRMAVQDARGYERRVQGEWRDALARYATPAPAIPALLDNSPSTGPANEGGAPSGGPAAAPHPTAAAATAATSGVVAAESGVTPASSSPATPGVLGAAAQHPSAQHPASPVMGWDHAPDQGFEQVDDPRPPPEAGPLPATPAVCGTPSVIGLAAGADGALADPLGSQGVDSPAAG